MNEGESVEVCAIITATDSTVIAALNVVDGSAIGTNSSESVHTITVVKWKCLNKWDTFTCPKCTSQKTL